MAETTADDAEAIVEHMVESALSREDVDAVLAGLAAECGLGALGLDEDGRCELADPEGRPVLLLYRPPFPGLVIAASVTDEAALAPRMQTALLRTNRSWAATGGGTFALLDGDGPVFFLRRVPLSGGGPVELYRAIMAHAAAAEAWETHITFILDAEDDAGAETRQVAGPVMIRV